MTTPTIDLLIDAFGRVRTSVHDAVDGLDGEALAFRVDSQANSIAWLVWHLTRIADDHIAGLDGSEQIWLSDGWSERFSLPLDPGDHGFGHTIDQVSTVVVDADLLLGYHDAVHDRTVAYLRQLTDADLPEIIDRRWDPPVTRAVRLVSVLNDGMQHVGQAAFVRGIFLRRG